MPGEGRRVAPLFAYAFSRGNELLPMLWAFAPSMADTRARAFGARQLLRFSAFGRRLVRSDFRRRRQGEGLYVHGIGKFKVKATAAREGRNPSSGETIQIKAAKKLSFGPTKAVKDRLNG